jgi:hypothetical protein
MNWITRGSATLSAPYRIISNIRGYEIWLSAGDKYGVLARQIQTLAAAKEYCEKHKAKERVAT